MTFEEAECCATFFDAESIPLCSNRCSWLQDELTRVLISVS